jgi:iron(III) transport system permease protein
VGTTLLVLAYLVLGPLAMLLLSSFKATAGLLPFSPGVPWTLQNYADVFLNASTWSLLGTTLVFSVGSLALSLTLSIGLAWLTERTDMPFRNVLFVMIVAAIGIPNVILGVAWELVLNPANGLINIVLRDALDLTGRGPLNVFTLPGMIFVQGISLVPITYLLIAAAFRAMDVSMEDAAAASGARYRTIVRRITLPLLTPALLSAGIYQFVTVIESFDIPLIIGLRAGIPVLATQIFIEARPPAGLPNYGIASTYSLFLLLLAIVPLLAYNRILGRSDRYATITGRSFQPRRIQLGAWRVPALLFGLGFVFVSLVVPGLVLVWTSLLPFYAVPSPEALARVSLDAYAELIVNRTFQRAVVNTLILGLAAGAATLVLCTCVSWILVRTRSRFRASLDVLAFAPHAMPGVIIGLSVLLIYLLLPLPLYGTIWVIVIAMTTQYISLATRLMGGGISQVKMELEEAAEASGASWWATLRRVVAPLVLPAFLNGFLLVFLLSIRNLTLPLILLSPDSIVLSTLVYDLWDRANTAGTAAVGVVMVTITVALSILLRRLNTRGGTVVA